MPCCNQICIAKCLALMETFCMEVWDKPLPEWVVPEKIHTPPTDGILEILAGVGSKTPEIQAGGGVDLKKVFCRGHFDR